MRSLSLPLARLGLVRWQLRCNVLWAFLVVPCVVMEGCVGGQTGTEAAPTDDADKAVKPTMNQDAAGETQTSTPERSTGTTVLSACDGSPEAVGNLLAQMGMSQDGIVAYVHGANPFVLGYAEGNTTNASLELVIPDPASGCVASLNGTSVLRVPVKVRIVSEDRRVALDLTGTVVAYPAASGGVDRAELDASVKCASGSAPEVVSDCGSLGIDLSGYAETRVELSARLQSSVGATRLLGSLQILGMLPKSCSEEACVDSGWATVHSMSLAR